MKTIVTGKEMKQLDRNTSEKFCIPELVLMEQAAMSFVTELLKVHSPSKVLVVCGFGNNGGDGVAVARMLNQSGVMARVFLASEVFSMEDKMTPSLQKQKEIYEAYGFPKTNTLEGSDYDFIIDALFGVGLSRNLSEPFCALIKDMNELPGHKVALDISSGIQADTGEVMGAAFEADETYTFSFEKVGQLLWPGFDYTGKVTVLPIGIDNYSWLDKKPKYYSLEERDLLELPKRMPHSNKGTYGKVLVIAGMGKMPGAAILAAKAAYKSGAGLVRVLTSGENCPVVASCIPEAIVSSMDRAEPEQCLDKEISCVDSIILGPGIGVNDFSKKVLSYVIEKATVPVVLDADALTILAEDMDLLRKKNTELILTPHLKEMSQLIREPIEYIQKNLLSLAMDFSNNQDVICVLKDFHTVIALPYGKVYINQTGNNGMAVGGSGDVLAGVIGGLMAQKLSPSKAAAFGVLLHGLAGDRASAWTGYHGMTANDIIDGLNKVWSQVDINVKE